MEKERLQNTEVSCSASITMEERGIRCNKWPNNITEQGKWHGLRTPKKESNGYIQTYERSNMLRAYESQRGMPIENDRQPPFLYGKCIFPSSISIDAHSQFRLHISQCDYIIETESLLSLSLSRGILLFIFPVKGTTNSQNARCFRAIFQSHDTIQIALPGDVLEISTENTPKNTSKPIGNSGNSRP